MMSDHVVETDCGTPISHLDRLGNIVPEEYLYVEKLVTPGEDLSLPTAYLKWYEIPPSRGGDFPTQIAESQALILGDLSFGGYHNEPFVPWIGKAS